MRKKGFRGSGLGRFRKQRRFLMSPRFRFRRFRRFGRFAMTPYFRFSPHGKHRFAAPHRFSRSNDNDTFIV